MKSIFLIATLLLFASNASAQVTRTVHHGMEDFFAGELDGLAVDSMGQLLPAPVSVESHATGSLYTWALGFDHRGRLWAGTGEPGAVLRFEGDEFVTISRTLALQVTCLMPLGTSMLAGSSPDGVVYAIDDKGNVTVALDSPQQTIWDLEIGSRAGSWLAATGPHARLVRGGEGAAVGEILHEFDAMNLTNLLRDEGGLWVAAHGPGLVFRIEGADDSPPRLRFEAPEPEIVAMVSDGDGGVFVLSSQLATEEQGAMSRLTWLLADGGNETVWSGPYRLVTLAVLEDGTFLVGEAETGRIYTLDRQGRYALWADLEGADPMTILTDRGTTWISTGNLGDVFALRATQKGEGSFESEVVETPNAQQWGRLWIDGWGDGIEFAARSGVRSVPDATWSEWSAWQPVGSTIAAPVAPYLQYRMRLTDATVHAVHLAYAERNLPPRVVMLKVQPAGGDFFSGMGMGNGGMPVSQQFEDGLSVEFSVGADPMRVEPEAAEYARGLRSIVWDAFDENDDVLGFEVEAMRLPDGDWITLATDLDVSVWAWDTRSMEDGHYRLRVTAHDHAAGGGREGAMVSTPIFVDNTGPRIAKITTVDGTVTMTAEDASSSLAEVHVRHDVLEEWQALVPVDGVLDGPREQFEFAAPEPGRSLWIRVVDAAGNVLVTSPRPGSR